MSQQQRFVKKSSLKNKLLFWFLVLSILPMLIIGSVNLLQANLSLKTDARNLLAESAIAKRDFLQNWFDFHFKNLNYQAQSPANAHFLMQLSDGLKTSNLTPKEYIKSDRWEKAKMEFDSRLVALLNNYDDLHDIFLIDLKGNILYSVVEESVLGDNLFKGSLADTGFAHSAQKTLNASQSLFSGIERYVPSNGQLAGFLTAPILNDNGNKIGVFAIQIKLQQLYKKISATVGNSLSRVHYLVDQQGSLISPINGHADVLNKIITSQPVLKWAKQELNANANNISLDEELHKHLYLGTNKQQVIGFPLAIRFANINWLLMSEIDESEALETFNTLKIITLTLTAFFASMALLAGLYQSRKIVRPIDHLSKATTALAKGNFNHHVDIQSDDEIGTLANAFNLMLDIRGQNAETAQQQQHKIQTALNSVSEQKFALDQHSIVAVTDLAGTITYVNNLFCKISGYSAEELMGSNHRILNSAYHDTAFFTDMYDTISSGDVFHAEICNKNKSGELYWVDTTIVPNKDELGKPHSYIAIRTDITHIKKAEHDLKIAVEAAEEASLAKSAFLANMSHEIRTPLNGVIGMTNLLLDSELNKEQFDRAKIVSLSATSLLSIINDILDFSKIEAGKLDLEIIDFDLRALMTDMASSLAYKAEEKNIELICPSNPIQTTWYKGDPGRIRQVFSNLVGNAIKFTEYGEVSVSANVLADGEQLYLLAEVKDTGLGLTPVQQKNLFKRFNQADNSTTRKFGGTGLGLAISKQLVELMGGEISAESTLNEGSSFYFSIKLSASTHQATPPLYASINDEKILIVDDNHSNRKLLVQLFSQWKVDCTQAKHGEEALLALKAAVAEGKPFTTAIIDMQMPGLDGLQLAHAIRENDTISDIHLMLLTSQTKSVDAKKIQRIGFDAFLTKPISQPELYNALMHINHPAKDEGHLRSHHSSPEITPFNAKILVVEDNITNQLVARGMLEKLQLQVDIAANGEEAIQLLSAQPYDLVFMDCQMPVMDGFEATQAIRDPASPVLQHDIPVIAMTANAMVEDVRRCTDAGMNAHVAKPVNAVLLHKALSRWLPKRCHGEKITTDHKITPKQAVIAAEQNAEQDFDATVLQELLGDSEQIIEIVQAFIGETTEQLTALQLTIDTNDVTQAAAISHQLKGSAASIGANEFARIAKNMEILGKAGELEQLADMLPSLNMAFSQLSYIVERGAA